MNDFSGDLPRPALEELGVGAGDGLAGGELSKDDQEEVDAKDGVVDMTQDEQDTKPSGVGHGEVVVKKDAKTLAREALARDFSQKTISGEIAEKNAADKIHRNKKRKKPKSKPTEKISLGDKDHPDNTRKQGADKGRVERGYSRHQYSPMHHRTESNR